MPRSKSSVSHKVRVKKVLKQAKGYYGKRKNIYSIAKQSVVRSGMYAFAHRKKKKGDFRRLWNVRINAALRPLGVSYSKFINALTKSNVKLNRKVLAYLACNDLVGFKKIVEELNIS